MSSPAEAAIVGIGCATPRGAWTQARSARFAVECSGLSGDPARFADAIYMRAGIDRRASALLDAEGEAGQEWGQTFYRPSSGPDDRGPTTAARMAEYAARAPELAATAAARALTDAAATVGGMTAGEITHLVVVSCTGFMSPGLDVLLIQALGLRPSVERLTIGFMGCHGGIIGLRTARQIAAAAPREAPARVLVVCVELCSLHYQYGDRPDQIVANALFADGAGAAVVYSRWQGERGAAHARIRAASSVVLPESTEAMSWTIGDHGFQMTLRESVPALIRVELGAWMRGWLTGLGMPGDRLGRDYRWAIHPGGPRVLQAVRDALELDAASITCSSEVLRDYGNMSSATVLFTIQRLLTAADREAAATPIVVVGFGPGLTAEAVLLNPGDAALPGAE